MGQIKDRLLTEKERLTYDVDALFVKIEKNDDSGVTNSPFDMRSIDDKQKRIKEIDTLLLKLNLP